LLSSIYFLPAGAANICHATHLNGSVLILNVHKMVLGSMVMC